LFAEQRQSTVSKIPSQLRMSEEEKHGQEGHAKTKVTTIQSTKVGWRRIFENPLTKLCRKNFIVLCVVNALAQFGLNMVAYCSRQPWMTLDYGNLKVWGLDGYWLFTMAQMLGETVSRLFGITWINAIKAHERFWWMIALYGISWVGITLFVLLPYSLGPIALMILGFGMGASWAVNYGYVDGRRFSGMVGSGMSTSLSVGPIFAEAFVAIFAEAPQIPPRIAMVYAASIGFVPFLLLLCVVESMPETTQQDVVMRGERNPMTAEERTHFYHEYGLAIVMMIVIYILKTKSAPTSSRCI
jgi:hypothetical protein